MSTQGFVQSQSLHTFKLEIISLYTWIKLCKKKKKKRFQPFRIGPRLTDENATEMLLVVSEMHQKVFQSKMEL